MADNLHLENKTAHRSAVPVIDVTAEPVGEVTLRDIVAILRRRIRLFLGVVIVMLAGVTVFLAVVTPKYQAKGQVLIHDTAAGRVRNINSVIATPVADVSDVPNAVKVLRSRVLAGTVVHSLALENDPEFNKKIANKKKDGVAKDIVGKDAQAGQPEKPQLTEANGAVEANGAAKRDGAAGAVGAVDGAKMAGPATVAGPAGSSDVTATEKTAVAVAEASDSKGPIDMAKSGNPPAKAGAADTERPAAPPFAPSQVQARIVDSFLDGLEVSSERRSRVVDVAFESNDPKKASKIVNELMETYLSSQVRYQKQALIKATQKLRKMVEEMRLEAVGAEDAVQAFRKKTRLVEGRGGENVTRQSLAELNSRLIQARAENAAVAARLNQMLTLLKSPGNMRSAPEILANPLIQRLRQTETDLLRQRSELTSRYGEKHPKMIKIHAEIRDLRQKIQDEMNKIVEGLSHEAAVARERVSTLEKELAELKNQAVDVDNIQVRLRELEQDAATKRTQHQTFLVRLRETSAQLEMIASTARIVSYAEVPTQPSFPNKAKTIALGAMLAGIIALVVVFVAEALRRTFETSAEVEALLGIRSLGVFPKVALPREMQGPSSQLRSNISNFQLGQSVRNVRSAIFLANRSRHPRSVLVTSPTYGEGKTTFVLSYASFCAANGQRVIVLDCDFGQPTLHKILGDGSNAEGIGDALLDEEALKRVIRTSSEMGFDYIPNGQLSVNRPELLDESSMKQLLDTLAWDYDVIMVDSSPVLAMTNAHILAKLVDSAVLLVRWRKTRRDQAKSAVRCLYGIGATIAGFVLTNVAPRGSESPDLLRQRRSGQSGAHDVVENQDFLQRHFRRSRSS